MRLERNGKCIKGRGVAVHKIGAVVTSHLRGQDAEADSVVRASRR